MVSNSIIWSVIISAITLVLSVSTSAIMIGVKWGKLSSDVDHMKLDLAEIKGMFQLKLKDD